MHVHAWPAVVRFQLIHLGLLIRSKRLIERCIRLRVGGCHLPHHGAYCVGCLLNAGSIILLHGRLQVLVRGLHLVMERFPVVRSLSKDGGSLLLLLRGQR